MRLLEDDNTEILSALEPEQMAEAKRRFVPRRQLKTWETALFWLLRIYVLFMAAVIIYSVTEGGRTT